MTVSATRVRPCSRVEVTVPASTANLGPGYDALGLALGFHDSVSVEVVDLGDGTSHPGAEVTVTGQGAETIATDERNLLVRSIRTALDRVGAGQPRLIVTSRNGVPFGRGMGSSAAAVVAGVVAARGLLEEPERMDDRTALEVASDLEGHPDNAAASLLGGMTIGWTGPGGTRAVRVEPHPDIVALVCLPDRELATAKARAMLPGQVPHGDAAYNAARSALLVEAMTRQPGLLLAGTSDRLHQPYRAPAMPPTAELIELLRQRGLAAVVSGAGPTVLVLGTAADLSVARVADLAGTGWDVREPGIDLEGARSTTIR